MPYGSGNRGLSATNLRVLKSTPVGNAALAAMGTIGAIFHEGSTYNPWRHTFDAVPHAALDTLTLTPEVGGTFKSNTIFRPPQSAGDLLSYVAMVSCLHAICPYVDPEGAARGGRGSYPVLTNINNPLVEEDTAAFAAVGGEQEWLQQNYGACSEMDVTTGSDCSNSAKPFVSYTVNVGVYLWNEVALKIGSQIVDTKTAQYIVAEDELAGNTDMNYTEMWGGAANMVDAILASSIARFCYMIPPFTFVKSLGSAVVMVAAIFSRPEFECAIEAKENLIIRSATNVAVHSASSGRDLSDDDVSLGMDCRFVLLENLYRDAFASSAFEQLILRTVNISGGGTRKGKGPVTTEVRLNCKGYTVAFVIMVQRQAALDKNMLNYYAGVNGMDALTQLALTLDGTEMFRVEAQRARMLWPAQSAMRIPRLPVYLMYFSPIVFSLQPIIGRNFSLVSDSHLALEWQDGLGPETCVVYVFQLQLTFIKYRKQHASLLFSS